MKWGSINVLAFDVKSGIDGIGQDVDAKELTQEQPGRHAADLGNDP